MARTLMFNNKNYEEVVIKACNQADDCIEPVLDGGDYSDFVRVIANLFQEIAALQGVAISLDRATADAQREVDDMVRYDRLHCEEIDSLQGQERLLEASEVGVQDLAAKAYTTLYWRVA